MVGQTVRLDVESGVADQQARVGRLEHEIQARRVGAEFRLDVVTIPEDQAGEGDGRPGTGIRGKGADFGSGDARDEQDAANRPIARDAEAGDDVQALAFGFDRGNEADIGSAAREAVGANGGDFKRKIENVPLGTMLEPPNQRTSIQETDGANTETIQLSVCRNSRRSRRGRAAGFAV